MQFKNITLGLFAALAATTLAAPNGVHPPEQHVTVVSTECETTATAVPVKPHSTPEPVHTPPVHSSAVSPPKPPVVSSAPPAPPVYTPPAPPVTSAAPVPPVPSVPVKPVPPVSSPSAAPPVYPPPGKINATTVVTPTIKPPVLTAPAATGAADSIRVGGLVVAAVIAAGMAML